jgi:hypothetical protein
MVKTFGNVAVRLAAWLTAMSHAPAPLTRWIVVSALVVVWFWAGMTGWTAQGKMIDDATYLTLGAIGVQDAYAQATTMELKLARFAGLFAPIAGLLFAFSGQLGRSLAQLCNLFAGGHIVIAGTAPAAVSLAQDCAKAGDVVVMVGASFPDETAAILRKSGIMLVMGDPTHVDALAAARAGQASHVVALEADDVANLRVEAAVKALIQRRGGGQATNVHVALKAPALLAEAREMRAEEGKLQAAPPKGKPRAALMEAKPFSLDELAARDLLTSHAGAILDAAAAGAQNRPHLICFGFDEAAEAVVARFLVTMWSARFGAPMVSVVARDAAEAEQRFNARYPQARKHDGMAVDIGFLPFDWRLHPIDAELLGKVAAKRAAASAFVVSTGHDGDNITLALAVRRASLGATAPIFMKEDSISEFSNIYASTEAPPPPGQPYLLTFGSYQRTATRNLIVEGVLDVAAGLAHLAWEKGVKARDSGHEGLEVLRKGWERVGETYRHANRASADSASVKLWDAGWRPARKGEKGASATLPPEMIGGLAAAEHNRWCAERVMNGWRPGPQRDNARRVHNNLVPFAQLSREDQVKDEDQVFAAVAIAEAVFKRGFVRAA